MKALSDDATITPAIAAHIAELWAHTSLQRAYGERNKFQLNDSAKFFFDKVRICCWEQPSSALPALWACAYMLATLFEAFAPHCSGGRHCSAGIHAFRGGHCEDACSNDGDPRGELHCGWR